MNNYFDKHDNYINCENLSLAEIYHRAFALGVESVAIEKRPQGEWEFKKITDDYRVYGRCSICKQRKRIDNFCPNCGAKMQKGGAE